MTFFDKVRVLIVAHQHRVCPMFYGVFVDSRGGGTPDNVFLRVYFDVLRQSSCINCRPSKQSSFYVQTTFFKKSRTPLPMLLFRIFDYSVFKGGHPHLDKWSSIFFCKNCSLSDVGHSGPFFLHCCSSVYCMFPCLRGDPPP